ncbi:MAG: fumarylacetoacetate hydrolase family protein [Alicyclobacillaceae bacterium]|nr:fumarylacetoacetate hydrolase family protein [Alicyclobacillaceae bacterium]
MRLGTFEIGNEERLGIELGDYVLDANRACAHLLAEEGDGDAQRLADALLPSDMLAFLRAGERALEQARRVVEFARQKDLQAVDFAHPLAAVRRLAPVPRPGKIVCVGRNYHEHVNEMNNQVPTIPVLFAKFSNVICAHGDPVPHPGVSEELDYEAELAVVIGKRGRRIGEQAALDHVAGYTAFNDITVRDWQRRTPQWLQGKTFDHCGPLGPVLVTKDEIPDPHSLSIRLWLNGELRQSDNTGRLIFNIPRLISFISQIMTLEPGDVIATGTPGGVGVAMNPPGFMKVGDIVRVEIERIGVLENKIVESDALAATAQ